MNLTELIADMQYEQDQHRETMARLWDQLPDLLNRELDRQGLSQSRVAQMLGVTSPVINYLATGKGQARISIDMVERVAELLEILPEMLTFTRRLVGSTYEVDGGEPQPMDGEMAVKEITRRFYITPEGAKLVWEMAQEEKNNEEQSD